MVQFRKTEQSLMSPPSSPDWLSGGHLAWFIHDAVDSLDVGSLETDELLDGHHPSRKVKQPCPPRVMLRLLFYAYCTGTFSSRRIAANTEVSVALRMLAAGHEPDHLAICRFREENLDQFIRHFVQVVEIAREARLVKLGSIVVDRSRVKPNTSEPKAMSDGWMLREKRRLRKEIAKLTCAAKRQDELDDDLSGPAEVTSRRPRRSDAGIASSSQ